jgi:hypothetical protein
MPSAPKAERNVTRPRAADDFAVIRSRLEELQRERARPRAADDFVAIHARLQELRRERERAQARTGRARGATAGPQVSAPENGPARE